MFDAALIEICKNPNVDSAIIREIIRVESNFQEFTVNVNKLDSFVLKNKEEAEKTAKEYIKKGYSVDMGLMQFNSKNLSLPVFNNLSISDLFDQCKNIKAGSDIFFLAYQNTDKNLNKEERINRALSVYNTGNQNLGFRNGYVAKYNLLPTLASQLTDKARKSDTRINLSYNLFNLDTKGINR